MLAVPFFLHTGKHL